MRSRNHTLDIARWEFLRFFRVKDFALSLILIVGVGLAIRFVGKLAEAGGSEPIRVAVHREELLPLDLGDQGRFVLTSPPGSEDDLREKLAVKEFDGLLLLRSNEQAALVVRSEAGWQEELGTLLSQARRDHRLEESGLSADELGMLLAPFQLEVRFADDARAARGPGKTGALVMIGLMLMGILVGSSYLFIGITGEKTQRVTEQIVAAVPAQNWIDGKILGFSGLAIFNLFIYVLGFVIYGILSALLLGDELSLPKMISDPFLFLAILILVSLGFYFWFTLFGLIASTINDPNTSARGTFLFLPFLPLGIAFAGVGQPDALWMKALGIFPLTSPTVLSSRLVLGEVAFWEFPLAVALLAVCIWIFRRAAGRVFALSMLMYGKEPTWGEVLRWARASR